MVGYSFPSKSAAVSERSCDSASSQASHSPPPGDGWPQREHARNIPPGGPNAGPVPFGASWTCPLGVGHPWAAAADGADRPSFRLERFHGSFDRFSSGCATGEGTSHVVGGVGQAAGEGAVEAAIGSAGVVGPVGAVLGWVPRSCISRISASRSEAPL
jgi:hypothetical protein